MSSGNTFAEASSGYASARPHYPRALFEWIGSECPERRVAWDCATGSGQAAVGLAELFDEVVATDIAAEQLAHGIPRTNITYQVAPAEACPLADHSVDLIAVAQALHWFDLPRFWAEVKRVATPQALVCVWGYAWFQCAPDLDAALVRPFRDIVEPFWAPHNGILWRGYQRDEIALPFDALGVPEFAIDVAWTTAQVIDYLCTWSAFKRSRADAHASAQMDALLESAAHLRADEVHAIRMPLTVVAARVRS